MSALRQALRELPETVFVDLLENDDAYLVVIDVPGVTADSVEVGLQRGFLHVEATRSKDVPEAFEYRSEERSPLVDVEVPVPADATDREATASIEGGVLEVRLPKQSDSAGTNIPVDVE